MPKFSSLHTSIANNTLHAILARLVVLDFIGRADAVKSRSDIVLTSYKRCFLRSLPSNHFINFSRLHLPAKSDRPKLNTLSHYLAFLPIGCPIGHEARMVSMKLENSKMVRV